MRRAFAIAPTLAVALAAAPAAQTSIARSVVADRQVMEYVRGLTALGPRLTGTAGYQRAAEWAAAELRTAGAGRVGFEAFTIPDGWERESASATITVPVQKTLRAASLGWMPSTPGPIEAELVAVSESAPEKVAGIAAQVGGRIV